MPALPLNESCADEAGIVTRFTVQAYPMGQVWGGIRIYDGSKADEIYAALHKFVPGNAEDPKAAIILTDVTAIGGLKTFLIFYFYQGPAPPAEGAFAEFLGIGSTISLTKTRSYADLVGILSCSMRCFLANKTGACS